MTSIIEIGRFTVWGQEEEERNAANNYKNDVSVNCIKSLRR